MTTRPPPHAYSIRPAKPPDVPLLGDIERSAGQLFRTVGLDSVADNDPMPAEVLLSYMEAGNLWVAVTDTSDTREGGVGGEGEGDGEREGEVVGFLAAFAITVTGSAAIEGSEQQEGLDNGTRERGAQDGSRKRKVLMHIAELSVHAPHHRRGLGKRLMRYFEEAVTGRSANTGSTSMAATAKTGKEVSLQEGQDVLGLSLTTYKDITFNGPFYARLGFGEVPPAKIETVVGKRGRELWDEEQGKIAMPERRCWMVKWLR